MNVASLELCEELYELSGWEATEKRWYGSLQFPNQCVAGLIDNFDSNGICPAYDTDYLLRELPEPILLRKKLGKYEASVRKGNRVYPCMESDTPANALCKLAIELFKREILKREDKETQP